MATKRTGTQDANDRLWDMYVAHGFKDKMVVVSGDYSQRLAHAIRLVDELLGGCQPGVRDFWTNSPARS